MTPQGIPKWGFQTSKLSFDPNHRLPSVNIKPMHCGISSTNQHCVAKFRPGQA